MACTRGVFCKAARALLHGTLGDPPRRACKNRGWSGRQRGTTRVVFAGWGWAAKGAQGTDLQGTRKPGPKGSEKSSCFAEERERIGAAISLNAKSRRLFFDIRPPWELDAALLHLDEELDRKE